MASLESNYKARPLFLKLLNKCHAEELRDYRLRFPNRQPFLADAPKINSPLHHALHDTALNEALGTSRAESQLPLLDADRERELIFDSQLAAATDH